MGDPHNEQNILIYFTTETSSTDTEPIIQTPPPHQDPDSDGEWEQRVGQALDSDEEFNLAIRRSIQDQRRRPLNTSDSDESNPFAPSRAPPSTQRQQRSSAEQRRLAQIRLVRHSLK